MGLNVDRVLDSIEPKDMDEWIAFDQIEPELMETLIGVVKRGFAAVMSAWGGEFKPDRFDPRKDKQDDNANEKQDDEVVDASPDQQVAFLKMMYSR